MCKMLNLGCGEHYHPDWINVDLVSSQKDVLAHDIRQPLPFPSNYFEVVYHSHVLEHLSKNDGFAFLKECHRVVKPGGILRTAVPDLEQIAIHYLKYLNLASQGSQHAEHYYDWILIEMYDQVVRTQSGGQMAIFLRNAPSELREFLSERIGYQNFQTFRTSVASSASPCHIPSLLKSPQRWLEKLKEFLTKGVMVLIWGHKGLQIAEEMIFRQRGELHRWMYDRYSLQRLLQQAGFVEVGMFTATTSQVNDWTSFCLDSDASGSIYKPDSLYCEGIKPSL